MTVKRRLVPVAEVKELLDFLRSEGFEFSSVDVRGDGVTFISASLNEYDRWKARDPLT